MPGVNFVYADVDGNIGWIGRRPDARPTLGHRPAARAGSERDVRVEGIAGEGQLPQAFNPDRGFVATANHNILPPGYPHEVGYEWTDRYRIRRVEEMLSEARKLTVADFQRMQHDELALTARALVPLLRGLRPTAPKARQAQSTLLSWDFRMDSGSAAAAIFAAWSGKLWSEYVRCETAPLGREIERALLESVPMSVIVEGLASPRAERDEMLLRALDSAVLELGQRLGPDMGRWRWGDLHQARFTHLLALDSPGRALFDRGPIARGGNGHTVNATSGSQYRQTSGASFRQIIDVADWDRSVATSAPGQSGQPDEPSLRRPAAVLERRPLLPSRVHPPEGGRGDRAAAAARAGVALS